MLPFARAVEIAGSKARLAGLLHIKPQAISQWRADGVPPDKCWAIEQVTAGRVRCEALRPDIEFQRDGDGCVTGYVVRIKAA
jgi:DNA-binding transcriptional regulator YdaS (Cro superfamily)